MEKPLTRKRALIPSIVVFTVLIGTSFAIDQYWKLNPEAPAQWIHMTGLLARGAFLFFGTYLIYPLAFRAGIPGKWRVALSFTPQWYWIVHQIVLLGPLYPVLEVPYTIINPVFIFFTGRTLFQIGLCEAVCRRLFTNRRACRQVPGINALVYAATGLIIMATTLFYASEFVAYYGLLHLFLFS